MKKYPLSEELGNIDEAFLEEVFEYQNSERRIRMSKKKIVSIVIAAALVVSIGVTAVAASWSRLNQLGDYFDRNKEILNIPDEVPIIKDPEIYGTEVNTNAATTESNDIESENIGADIVSYAPPAPGTAQITTISSTEHSIYATIEFNAEGLDIPLELPEDAMHDAAYQFEWVKSNFSWSNGSYEFISRDGNIFTYVFSRNNVFALPEDDIVLTLQRFGYFNTNKDFVTLHDIEVEVRLPVEKMNVMKSLKSMNTVNIMGAEYTAEIAAYEFTVYTDIDELIANGLGDNYGYILSQDLWNYLYNASIEFHMIDGTVFIDDLGTYESDKSYLITSQSGISNPDAGTNTIVYSFEVPVDISQIDYITLNDVPFYFSSAQ